MELSLEVLRCSLYGRQNTQKETILFHLLLPVLPLVLWTALMEPHRLNRRLKTEAAFVLLPEQYLCSAVITPSHSGKDNYSDNGIRSIDDKRSASL